MKKLGLLGTLLAGSVAVGLMQVWKGFRYLGTLTLGSNLYKTLSDKSKIIVRSNGEVLVNGRVQEKGASVKLRDSFPGDVKIIKIEDNLEEGNLVNAVIYTMDGTVIKVPLLVVIEDETVQEK